MHKNKREAKSSSDIKRGGKGGGVGDAKAALERAKRFEKTRGKRGEEKGGKVVGKKKKKSAPRGATEGSRRSKKRGGKTRFRREVRSLSTTGRERGIAK